jgi:hypothetical protein
MCGTSFAQCNHVSQTAFSDTFFGVCASGHCQTTSSCPLGAVTCGTSCARTDFDPMNCGSCGRQCSSDHICQYGQCLPLSSFVVATTNQNVDGGVTVSDVFIDGTRLLYTDPGGNAVYSVPLSGGAPTTLGSNQYMPVRVVGDGTYAYWSSAQGGAILRAPENGAGGVEEVAPASGPAGIAVDGSYVYWADTGSGTLLRAAKAGTDGAAPLSLGAIWVSGDIFWGPGGKLYASCVSSGQPQPCFLPGPDGPLTSTGNPVSGSWSPVGALGTLLFSDESPVGAYSWFDTTDPTRWVSFDPYAMSAGQLLKGSPIADEEGCALVANVFGLFPGPYTPTAVGLGMVPASAPIAFPIAFASPVGRLSRSGTRLAFSFSTGVAVIAIPP